MNFEEDFRQYTASKLKEVKQWNDIYGRKFVAHEIEFASKNRMQFLRRMENYFKFQLNLEVQNRYNNIQECSRICPELTLPWHKKYKPLGRGWYYLLNFLSLPFEEAAKISLDIVRKSLHFDEAMALSKRMVKSYSLELSQTINLSLSRELESKNLETFFKIMSCARIITLINGIRSPLVSYEWTQEGKLHSRHLFVKGAVPCDFCHKSNEKLKSCAGCHHRAYCSRECQVKDWSSHRECCPQHAKHRERLLKLKKKQKNKKKKQKKSMSRHEIMVP